MKIIISITEGSTEEQQAYFSDMLRYFLREELKADYPELEIRVLPSRTLSVEIYGARTRMEWGMIYGTVAHAIHLAREASA